MEKIWKKMERWGIRKERLQLEWISAAEGIRFAKVMAGMEELRRTVTREEIAETRKILEARLKKKKAADSAEEADGLRP